MFSQGIVQSDELLEIHHEIHQRQSAVFRWFHPTWQHFQQPPANLNKSLSSKRKAVLNTILFPFFLPPFVQKDIQLATSLNIQ